MGEDWVCERMMWFCGVGLGMGRVRVFSSNGGERVWVPRVWGSVFGRGYVVMIEFAG